MNIDAEQLTTVARGISDFGLLAIAAGRTEIVSRRGFRPGSAVRANSRARPPLRPGYKLESI